MAAGHLSKNPLQIKINTVEPCFTATPLNYGHLVITTTGPNKSTYLKDPFNITRFWCPDGDQINRVPLEGLTWN